MGVSRNRSGDRVRRYAAYLENSGHDWRLPSHRTDPRLTAWLVRRATKLCRRSDRAKRAGAFAKSAHRPPQWQRGCRLDRARVRSRSDANVRAASFRCYAGARSRESHLARICDGTYTDPAALDLLLGALPAPAVILEDTPAAAIWRRAIRLGTEARENRAWISNRRLSSAPPGLRTCWRATAHST